MGTPRDEATFPVIDAAHLPVVIRAITSGTRAELAAAVDGVIMWEGPRAEEYERHDGIVSQVVVDVLWAIAPLSRLGKAPLAGLFRKGRRRG